MPDLDAAIREQIHQRQDENWGVQQLAPALLAVLELHPAEAHECPALERTTLRDDELYTAYDSPCETRQAIAKALGIEVA